MLGRVSFRDGKYHVQTQHNSHVVPKAVGEALYTVQHQFASHFRLQRKVLVLCITVGFLGGALFGFLAGKFL